MTASTATDQAAASRNGRSMPEENPVAVGAAVVAVALVGTLAVVSVLLLSSAGFDMGWVAVVAGTVVCAIALLVLVATGLRRPRRPSVPSAARESTDGLVALPVAVVLGAAVVGIAVALTPLLTLPVLATFALVLGVSVVLWFLHRFPTALLVLFVIRPALDQFKVGSDGLGAIADPSVLSGIVFLLAAALWLLGRHRSGRAVQLSRSSTAFVALGLVCMLSSVTAALPVVSMQASVRVLASAVMFVVLEETFRDSPARLRPLLVAVFASLVVPAAFASLQLVGSAPVQPLYGPAIDVGRIQGTFVHPNAFATYLVVLIPLALALLRHVTLRVKAALLVTTLLSAGLLLFTYARAAWFAALLGVLIVGWLQDRRIITTVVVGVLLLTVAVPSVSTRLGELGQGRDELTDDPNSLVWRIDYWSRILPSMSEGPITGIGLGMVEEEFIERLPPHNVFVQAAAETGLAGLAALLYLIASIASDLRLAYRRARPGLARGVVVGAIGVSAGFLAQCFSENLLNQPVSHWYLLVPVAWATTHAGRAPFVLGRLAPSSSAPRGSWSRRAAGARPAPVLPPDPVGGRVG